MFSAYSWGHEGEKASWSFIVWESRLPQALTALLCGGALAVCGLMLQTAFKIRWQARLFWALIPGRVWEWPSWCCFWWGAYRPEHSVCPVSFRIGWGVCRCYADNGTYPILFYVVKKQCHVADNGYHDRLYRFVRHCPAEFLCYGGGSAILYDMGIG